MSYRDTWATCEKCGKQFVFTIEAQRQLGRRGNEVTPPTLCPKCAGKSPSTVQAVDNLNDPGPHEGIVKWYSSEKGYGFITLDGGQEIFFHHSGIAMDELAHIQDGARVTFVIEQTDKGPAAVDVASMDAAPLDNEPSDA